MSLAEGLQIGMNFVNMQRSQKQKELTALQQGYTQDEQGNWQKSENLTTRENLETEQLKATVQALQMQNQNFQYKMNADAITGIMSNWTSGNSQDALQTWKTTPGLKEAITNAKTLNIQDIDTVNFNNPNDLQHFKNLGIDTSLLTPEAQDALSKSFMRIQGKDGNWRLTAVNELMAATNSYNNFTQKQRDLYTENARMVNGILQGISPTAVQATEATAKVTEQTASAQLKDLQDYLSIPGNTYTGYLAEQKKKQQTPSEAAAEFKLGQEKKIDTVLTYIAQNKKEFNEALATGDLDSTYQGQKLYEVATISQGDKEIDNSTKALITGSISTVENMGKLHNRLQDGSFDWDAYGKLKSELSKYTPEDWKLMSEPEKQALLTKYSFDSELQAITAGYIKAMSGAAVSDDERKFYVGAISGGGWANKSTALASMKGFVRGVNNSVQGQLKGLLADYPKSYLDYKSQLASSQSLINKGPNGGPSTVIPSPSSSTTQPAQSALTPREQEALRRGYIKRADGWYKKDANGILEKVK